MGGVNGCVVEQRWGKRRWSRERRDGMDARCYLVQLNSATECQVSARRALFLIDNGNLRPGPEMK